MTDRPLSIWALLDNQAGNRAQVLGVAEALGLPFIEKNLVYTAAAGLPNVIRGKSFTGLDQASRAGLCAPWPDLVIAAGRRTAPVARAIKKAGSGKPKLCQIMYPGSAGASDFDLIAVPKHDNRKGADNILSITGAPHRVTGDRLAGEAARWAETFKEYPKPWISVIVGGSTRKRVFSEAMAADLAGRASAMAAKSGGSLLVTTSRRTGDKALAKLKAHFSAPTFLYEWGDGGDNPYFGLLALADAVIVTGESVSMCSEAAAAAAPLYIFAPDGLCAPKHQRLHDDLYAKGYAKPFTGVDLDFSQSGPRLNAAGEVAESISNRLLMKRSI